MMTIEQIREYLKKQYREPRQLPDDWRPADQYDNDVSDAYDGGWADGENAMAAHLITLIDGPTQP